MIKVMVPHMPTADDLLPLLRRIDNAKQYTNRGPLVVELEQVLTKLVGAPAITVGNGTVALELALRALSLPLGSGVLVPAVTFAASGLAIANAGLRPVLADVDQDTWQLTAKTAAWAAERCLISAAMPVAAFGMPVAVEPWERFAEETGLPVVIDAAGAISEQCVSTASDVLTAFSLHATKFVGAGEGGFIATHDHAMRARLLGLSTFGRGGTNAKLSEYHAAVALASLCVYRMDARMARGSEIATAYADGLAALPVKLQRVPSASATLLPVLLPTRVGADAVQRGLAARRIETKRWYLPFLDELEQFAGCACEALFVTQNLRDGLLGLPFHTSMSVHDVRTVCRELSWIIQ
jgi:dTDP-4-amino-4,6-dideoxygalactose transaminase